MTPRHSLGRCRDGWHCGCRDYPVGTRVRVRVTPDRAVPATVVESCGDSWPVWVLRDARPLEHGAEGYELWEIERTEDGAS